MLAQVDPNSDPSDMQRFSQALMRVSLPDIDQQLRRVPEAESGDVDRHEAAAWLIECLRQEEPSLKTLIAAWLRDRKIADRTFLNTLWWAEKGFDIWTRHSRLDDFIKRAFARRRFVFAAILLEYMEFVFEDDHALARMIELLERLFQGWQDTGEAPPGWIHAPLKRFGEFLDDPRCLEEDFREQVLADIEAAWQKESGRRSRLEQRLMDSERGLDDAWYSQNAALHCVNEALRSPVPKVLIDFLTGPWLDSLRLTFLDSGAQSKRGRIVHALTQNLAWLCRERPESDRQRQLSLGARILDDLEPHFISLDHVPDQKVAWMDRLQALVLSVLKGESLERVRPDPLPAEASPDPLDNEETLIGPWLGRWFAGEGGRRKLLMYLPGRQQILWCDINGRKLGYQPVRDFLEKMAAGELQPLDEGGTLRLALRKVAAKMVELDAQQQARRAEQARKREVLIRQAREKAAAEAERLKRVREALKAEAKSTGLASAEGENTGTEVPAKDTPTDAPLSEETTTPKTETGNTADMETEPSIEAAATADTQVLPGADEPDVPAPGPMADGDSIGSQRMYSRILETLKADSWIRVETEKGPKKYRIAARLQSTGKFILANELGTRAGDLSWQEALDLLSDGRLTILGEGEDMNARMTRTFGRVTRRRK